MIYYKGNTLHVCIDDINGQAAGRAYMMTRKEPILFADFGEMVVEADRQFDRQGFPQSFQDKRSFVAKDPAENRFYAEPEILTPLDGFIEERGIIASFIIQVESRQNATWQGVVRKIEGEMVASFDSEMHLLDWLQSQKNK